MNTIINHFASSNTKIAAAVQSVLNLTFKAPDEFRLMVRTPKEASVNTGLYSAEAQVILALQDIAYNELVAVLNKVPRNDAYAVADRGRSLSGFEDEYDGAEEKEATYLSIEDEQEIAAVAASMVHTYANHIANIKESGAGWITNGFSQTVWIAADAKDAATTKLLAEDANALPKLITEGKVKRVTAHVEGRLQSFKQWCAEQGKQEWINVDWKVAMAYAATVLEKAPSVDVNDACDFIGDWASKCRGNKTVSRLTEAVTRVADKKYRGIGFSLNKGDTYISPTNLLLISYSPLLQKDISELFVSPEWATSLMVKLAEMTDALSPNMDTLPLAERIMIREKAKRTEKLFIAQIEMMPEALREGILDSDEFQDFEMAESVHADAQAAKAMLRDAQRQVKIAGLAAQMKANEDTRKAAQELLESLKPKAEAKPEAKAKRATKPKVQKIPAADAPAVKPKKVTLKNIGGKPSALSLNTKGLRH